MTKPAPDSVVATPAADELLDAAPCGFVSFRDHGIIIAANATLGRMLGVDRSDLLGAHIDTILGMAARIYYQTHFFPLLTLHGAADEIYMGLKAGSGEIVHVLATARRARGGDGAEPRNDCVFLRIHERQKYERELLMAKKAAEEANSAKTRFLSMMSHDLRTPLSAVSGYADLLLLGVRGSLSEQQVHDIKRIKAASSFLLGMLNDILTFARIEVGQVAYRLTDLKISGAITRAEALMGTRFEDAGIKYHRAECSEAVLVRADADRLQQVMLNLLTNAAKFTERGGRVTVDCERSGDQVMIRVRDTGRGIPEDKLEAIFEPFLQVEGADQRRGGVGLGLAISRELTRAMGGDIRVSSVPGKGSVFEVILPAGRAAEPQG